MNNDVKMIPIGKLYPHPDNPRKDIGDIEELVASIKANGILQNLTVVPRIVTGEITGQQWQNGYTVIIGHRRLAAAKQAGLAELPCIVVEGMSLEEQVSAMLTENIQRSDLTVYEEAEGFQMMMDLGSSLEQVADKAGFSESTIRRRVKLLSLDKDEFKKSVDRGATLSDFAMLDKLKSDEEKNEVLKSMGTNNFRAELDKAIRRQDTQEKMDAVRAVLDTYATKVERTSEILGKTKYCDGYSAWSSKAATVPDDAGSRAYWYTDDNNYISVYCEADEQSEKTPEQIAHEAEVKEWQRKAEVLDEDEKTAYRLRVNFLKECGFPVKEAKTAVHAACRMLILSDFMDKVDTEMMVDIFGDGILVDGNLDTAELLEKEKENPMRMLIALIIAAEEAYGHEIHDVSWGRGYRKCIIDKDTPYRGIYSALDILGYEMSDLEKSILYGKHPSYAKEES